MKQCTFIQIDNFRYGEKLLYKIYLKSSDKTPSNISKVSYVELVDNTKQTIFKNKIILENTIKQGITSSLQR
jgi:hypothetical protein